MLERYIDIGNDIYKIRRFNKKKKCKPGYAYIKGDFVYPFRGNYNKRKSYKIGIYERSNGKYKVIKTLTKNKFEKYHISNMYKIDLDSVNRILDSEGVISKDMDVIMGETNDVFAPIISDNDNALQKIIKEALIRKQIDIKNYAGRFRDAGDLSNHKRALLHHGKMSFEKFIKWCNVLDLDYRVIISDKRKAINPMKEEVCGY